MNSDLACAPLFLCCGPCVAQRSCDAANAISAANAAPLLSRGVLQPTHKDTVRENTPSTGAHFTGAHCTLPACCTRRPPFQEYNHRIVCIANDTASSLSPCCRHAVHSVTLVSSGGSNGPNIALVLGEVSTGNLRVTIDVNGGTTSLRPADDPLTFEPFFTALGNDVRLSDGQQVDVALEPLGAGGAVSFAAFGFPGIPDGDIVTTGSASFEYSRALLPSVPRTAMPWLKT